jgi:outer membrane protein OmpA-like peptidoglycan-associated protein
MLRSAWLMAAAILLIVPTAFANDVSGRLGVGLEGGYMKLIHGDWDYSNVDQFAGFRLQRGLSPRLSLELAFKYGWIRPGVTAPGEDAGLTFDSGAGLYTVIYQPRVGLLYHLAPERRFSPFLGLSVGGTAWRVKDQRNDLDFGGIFPDGPILFGYNEDGERKELRRTDFTASVTLGADLFLSSALALNLGARYHLMPFNDLDNVGLSGLWGPDNVDANTGMVDAFAGLTVFFGSRDSDGDGIDNKQDACPHQPEDFDGFQDEDGCPDLDNDGDGIPDSSDGCPDAAEDQDGFQDDDGCPDPDNDGDGIVDAVDKCPDTAEDLDGFQDDDGCPDPDNDGDGVLDTDDRCPGTPAGIEVDENGCPVVEEIKEDLVLKGVNFLSGSSELTPESLAVLNRVAHSLKAWPEVKIEVRGHTDATGSAESNRVLSEKRALAVRDYLIAQGISADRITARGFGEDFPIAPNDTREGRAKNRRVEIHRTN